MVDPHWTWAEREGRYEDSRSGTLTPEATARLKLLQRAAVNFAARLPSIDQWANFLRAEIIPVYNAVLPDARMCLECAKRMPNKKASTHVCSPECATQLRAAHAPSGHARRRRQHPAAHPRRDRQDLAARDRPLQETEVTPRGRA